ncbi:MAG: hypothetical protein E6767_02420 [Dysgonomonas sp.]|nr:hypothetical protein [Dysgonomonas sp.]
METIRIAVTLTLIAITSLYWGALLSLKLPEFSSRFDRKPFNCRPCLTFHLMWGLSLLSALILWSGYVLAIGFPLAFIVFAITKIIDNKRIIK